MFEWSISEWVRKLAALWFSIEVEKLRSDVKISVRVWVVDSAANPSWGRREVSRNGAEHEDFSFCLQDPSLDLQRLTYGTRPHS